MTVFGSESPCRNSPTLRIRVLAETHWRYESSHPMSTIIYVTHRLWSKATELITLDGS
jgi:hypothetical protein